MAQFYDQVRRKRYDIACISVIYYFKKFFVVYLLIWMEAVWIGAVYKI